MRIRFDPALNRREGDPLLIHSTLIHYRVDGRMIRISTVRTFLLRYRVQIVLQYVVVW